MVQTHLLKLTRRIDPQFHGEAFIKPESALSWLHWHSADLLVCDSLFPDIGAAELIRRIRQLPDCNDLSILMMAPWSDGDGRRQVLRIIAEQLGLSQADCEAIEVQERGKYFDPDCLDAFISQLDRVSNIQFMLGDKPGDVAVGL
jgi:response regulator RpfG family c-di-GMP phosphodiesterase